MLTNIAFCLKPTKLPDYDIIFTITEKAEKQMNDLKIEPPNVPLFFLDKLFKANVYSTFSAPPASTSKTHLKSRYLKPRVH